MPTPWRAAALLGLGLGLTGCVSAAAGGLSPTPFYKKVGVSEAPSEARQHKLGPFNIRGSFEIAAIDDGFGGISGAAVIGADLYLVSDRARLYRARLVENDAGDLVGLVDWKGWPLHDAADPKRAVDAEDLAVTPNGRLVVSDEATNRLGFVRLDTDAAWVDFAAIGEAFPVTRTNLGAEAVAALPDGRLLALSEGEPLRPGVLRASVLTPGEETLPATLGWPQDVGFAPTATATDDGCLYVLSRRFGLLGGFEARLSRLPLAQVRAGANLAPEPLAAFGAGVATDNYEALAVRRGREGKLRLLVLSDDNFSPLQRTLLIELRLDEGSGA